MPFALRATHYARGYRRFIAVGGDGTSYEIVNGLFPSANAANRPTLGISPAWHRQFLPARLHRSTGWRSLCEALLAQRTPRLRCLRMRTRRRHPLHQPAERGICRGCQCHRAARTFRRMGRDRLLSLHLPAPGAASPAPFSLAGGRRGCQIDRRRACFSLSTTASSPAAR